MTNTAQDIAVEGKNHVLRVGEDYLTPAQIKHIIVNKDNNDRTELGGSVVVETIPSPARVGQVQADFLDKRIVQDIEQFSQANGIGITTTEVDTDRFHRTFWDSKV